MSSHVATSMRGVRELDELDRHVEVTMSRVRFLKIRFDHKGVLCIQERSILCRFLFYSLHVLYSMWKKKSYMTKKVQGM